MNEKAKNSPQDTSSVVPESGEVSAKSPGKTHQSKNDKKENTRDVLLRVMVQTLDEHGESGVRLERVLRDANASVSSMYHYFGNLAGFIEAAQLFRFRRTQKLDLEFLRLGFGSVSTRSEFRDLLMATIKRTFQPERKVVRAQGINAVARSYQNPEYAAGIRELLLETNQILANELVRMQEKGFIPAHVDVEVGAAWWTSNLYGRYFVEILDNPSVDERFNNLTQQLAFSILEIAD